MLVDSHCHLDSDDYKEEGLAAVVARAQEAGIGRILTISTKISEIDKIFAAAETSPIVHCTVGTHPDHAHEESFSTEEIIALTKHPKVAGIGETGLDYYRDNPLQPQQESFVNHIEAGLRENLPLVIHTRNADEDTIRILTEAGKHKSRGVMHCFTGGIEMAKKSLDLGFYISFSGIITFKNAADLREVVKYVPMDRMLVETDAPWLAPMPHRGKRNEPAYVAHTAQMVAQVRGDLTTQEVAAKTTENFFKLFDRIKK